MERAAASDARRAHELVLLDAQPMYVSQDRHTTFLEIYPPGPAKFDTTSGAEQIRAAAARRACRPGSRST